MTRPGDLKKRAVFKLQHGSGKPLSCWKSLMPSEFLIPFMKNGASRMGLALPPRMLGFHHRAHAAVTGRAPQSLGQQAPGAMAWSAQPRLLTLSGSQPWPSKLCSAIGRTPTEGAAPRFVLFPTVVQLSVFWGWQNSGLTDDFQKHTCSNSSARSSGPIILEGKSVP